MLKKGNKPRNKSKRVHFNENQVVGDKNNRRPHSVGKLHTNENINNNIKVTSSKMMSSNMSTVSTEKKTTIEDFNIIQELGSGSYAKVILARHLLNGKVYAIKKINKNMLNNYEKQHEVHIEKQILSELKHPNIIKLHKTFQDKKHLYFVIEYCKNKDLGRLINILGKFDYKLAKYYAAEILQALSFMHKQNIFHRDVKPENIGLDENMHIKFFDFATSIKTNKYFDLKTMRFIDLDEDSIAYINENQNNTLENIIQVNDHKILLLNQLFVGTPEYVSPEVLEHNYPLIGPSIDIWAFGIMIYLFFTGSTPFKAKEESEILEKIKNVDYTFQGTDIPKDAQDLISKILIKDPTKRIGYYSSDYEEIKNHPFFKDINFNNFEYEDPPMSDEIKGKLFQFGYFLPNLRKINTNNDLKELYEDRDNGDDEDDDNCEDDKLVLRLSSNNFEDLKNNLKGETVEHHINIEKEDNEEDVVILEDTMQKKSPWLHYNTRLVKLFSKGHIDYYDPKTNQLKGSFVINKNCNVNVIDDFRFEIETINRNYYFKHKSKMVSNEWADKINAFIVKSTKKNKK
jgi:serine/threonine protein kinase